MNKLNSKAVRLFLIRFLAIGSPVLLLGVPIITILLGTALGTYGLWLWVPILGFYIALGYVWALLAYRNWRYEFTEDEVRIKKGIIFKNSTTIPYSRIQNVDINRSIFDRFLGLSTLEIQTAGSQNSWSDAPGLFKIIKFLYRSSEDENKSEGKIPGLTVDKAEQFRSDLTSKM